MGRPYFAYGSNMDRDQMRVRCPGAELIGPARLDGYRYLVNQRGVATVVPLEGSRVHGLVWELDDHHEAELDRYEGVAGGFYRRERLVVTAAHRDAVDALVYVAADESPGAARPDYQELIVAAAEREGLPAPYLAELRGWLPSA